MCGGVRAERWPNHLSLWGDTGGIQAGKVCNVASTNSTSDYSLWHLAVQTLCQSYFYSPTFNIYLSHLAQNHTIVIVIVYMMMILRLLKLFAEHSQTRYKHNATKLLDELDFSECEFAFSIFLPRQALSVCLFEKSPLRCNYLGWWGKGGHGHWGNILGERGQIWICDRDTNMHTIVQGSKLHKHFTLQHLFCETHLPESWDRCTIVVKERSLHTKFLNLLPKGVS